MYAVPDVEEVVAVARSLGIHLGPDEAALYRKYLLEQLDEADAFVQARIEEPAPPMLSPARTPPRKPSADEDPLNAWMWKFGIDGEADGLLAGKTVSFKDHIAVAGVPMTLRLVRARRAGAGLRRDGGDPRAPGGRHGSSARTS